MHGSMARQCIVYMWFEDSVCEERVQSPDASCIVHSNQEAKVAFGLSLTDDTLVTQSLGVWAIVHLGDSSALIREN